MGDNEVKAFKEIFAREPAADQLQVIRELRDIALDSAEADVLKAQENLKHIELILSQLQELK